MDIASLKTQIDSDIQSVASAKMLEEFRLKYLGRKGLVAELTASIPSLPPQERADFGRQVNDLKNKINGLIREKQGLFGQPGPARPGAGCDITLPGVSRELGRLHPITQVIEEICAVFTRMGFAVVEGPEIETEFNNFTGLNIPLEHPSRDAFDTFYLKNLHQSTDDGRRTTNNRLLLRSHTSPVQVRVMQAGKPPLAVIVPGRVYRPDAVDASHSFMFHQVEGLMVDKGIRFSDLKGVLEAFIKEIFGSAVQMRFRPHFFPFTEPSAEVDISCIICGGAGWLVEPPAAATSLPRDPKGFTGCSVCGRKGWLEILGAGMVHPNVFRQVGYDSQAYTGFAFGMGVERIAMLKYGIDDIRLFFQNDLRFLKQF